MEYGFDYARGRKIWGNGLSGDQYFYRYLLDGRDDTLWKCRYPYISPQYISIDLEQERFVNCIKIKEPQQSNSKIKNFCLELSMDGEKWFIPEQITHSHDHTVITCEFNRCATRFIRLTILEFNPSELSLVAIEATDTTARQKIAYPQLPAQIPFHEEVIPAKLVYESTDGFLHYAPYDADGNCIPDFSNVGYRGGECLPNNIPVKIVLEPAADAQDDSTRIQQAILEVAQLPANQDGYRGAILLKKGTYHVNAPLSINHSGIVLMGEGNSQDGTVIHVNMDYKTPFIRIEGTNDMEEIPGSRRKIMEDYIPVGQKSVTLEDTCDYKVGDAVVLHIQKNQAWIDTLGMGEAVFQPQYGKTPWTTDFYQFRYQSKIEAIHGNQVILDQPIVDPCDRRYGTYEIYRYKFNGRIRCCGVYNLCAVSYYRKDRIQNHDLFGEFFEDNDHASVGVYIDYAEDCWVKNFSTVYFGNSCVSIWKSAKRITVEDCQYLKPVSTLVGGNRYAFSVNGQQNLVRDCYSEYGRHDFVTGATTHGPNVFFRCTAEHSYQNSENHHRWGTATLYDNVHVSGPNTYLSAGNRGDCGTGHGWSGAQMVFWNCTAPTIAVQKPPLAQNLAIGVSGILDHKENQRAVLDAIDWYNQQGHTDIPYDGNSIWGNGYIESPSNTVAPTSLYVRQLEDRRKRLEEKKNDTK